MPDIYSVSGLGGNVYVAFLQHGSQFGLLSAESLVQVLIDFGKLVGVTGVPYHRTVELGTRDIVLLEQIVLECLLLVVFRGRQSTGYAKG